VVHGGPRALPVHEPVDMVDGFFLSRIIQNPIIPTVFVEAPKLFHIYDLVPGLKENQFPVLKFYVLARKTSNSITFLTVIPF
jgi:hypothetical protein